MEGDDVEITGLVQGPEFNGCRGLLLRFSVVSDRWSVLVHGIEKYKLISQENLRLVYREGSAGTTWEPSNEDWEVPDHWATECDHVWEVPGHWAAECPHAWDDDWSTECFDRVGRTASRTRAPSAQSRRAGSVGRASSSDPRQRPLESHGSAARATSAAPRGRGERRTPCSGAKPEAARQTPAANDAQAPQRLVAFGVEDVTRAAQRSPAFAIWEECAWKAIAKVTAHYKDRGFGVQCFVRQDTLQRCPPPRELLSTLVPCPPMDTWRDAEQHFLLRFAQTYDGHFVSNSNFRDVHEGDSHPCHDWLLRRGTFLKVEYVFDIGGVYIPTRSV